MSVYTKHVFFCVNLRKNEKACCQDHNAAAMREYMKTKLKKQGLHGLGKIRVSSAGCLGRCKLGPCMVIYPEGIWYNYKSEACIDEIIESHLLNNDIVERLLIKG